MNVYLNFAYGMDNIVKINNVLPFKTNLLVFNRKNVFGIFNKIIANIGTYHQIFVNL
jgi:hypothetical protein